MEYLRGKMLFVLVFSFVLGMQESRAADSIKIAAKNSTMRVGEPLFLSVTYNYEEPQISASSGKIRSRIRKEHLKLKVKSSNGGVNKFVYVLHADFNIEGTSGLVYKGEMFVWYQIIASKDSNPLSRDMGFVFDSEGHYLVSLLIEGVESNVLSIDVLAPLAKEKKALSILSHPNDYLFLLSGECEKEEEKAGILSRLEEVVNQCEGTTLAKWCAAHLSLEYLKEFYDLMRRNNYSHEEFKKLRMEGQVQDSPFDKSYLYLTKGAALPDEFPIRREVLYELAVMEYYNNDFAKVESILDEIIKKYPNSEESKRAVSGKVEIKEAKQKEIAMFGSKVFGSEAELAQGPRWGIWAVLIIGAGLAGAAGIWMCRKKRLARS